MYTINCLLFLKSGNAPALSSSLLMGKNSYSRYQTEEMEYLSICFQNTHIKVIPVIAAPHQVHFYIITDTMY